MIIGVDEATPPTLYQAGNLRSTNPLAVPYVGVKDIVSTAVVEPIILGKESIEVVEMLPLIKGAVGKVVVVEKSGEELQFLSY